MTFSSCLYILRSAWGRTPVSGTVKNNYTENSSSESSPSKCGPTWSRNFLQPTYIVSPEKQIGSKLVFLTTRQIFCLRKCNSIRTLPNEKTQAFHRQERGSSLLPCLPQVSWAFAQKGLGERHGDSPAERGVYLYWSLTVRKLPNNWEQSLFLVFC